MARHLSQDRNAGSHDQASEETTNKHGARHGEGLYRRAEEGASVRTGVRQQGKWNHIPAISNCSDCNDSARFL